MRNILDLTSDETGLFGPGTDLTLSLVAILTIFVFVLGRHSHELENHESALRAELLRLQGIEAELGTTKKQLTALRATSAELSARAARAQLDLQLVLRNQMQVIADLAEVFQADFLEAGVGTFEIPLDSAGPDTRIIVSNDATLQRIHFGSSILFDSDRHLLKPQGVRVLTRVASALRPNLGAFLEIQIQGHADTDSTRRYDSNLDLAAQRAVQVFELLRKEGIDPTSALMSASSFGEFYPVSRRHLQQYNATLLRAHNRSKAQKDLNRRIEIVLLYRRS